MDLNINEVIQTVGVWMITNGVKVILVVILMMIALKVAQLLTDRFSDLLAKRSPDHEFKKRASTLSSIIRYVVKTGIYCVGIMMVLNLFGINVGPVIAAAGVVGLAVGFGAQNLVKDVISGFFILLEDQIRVGDVVNIQGKAGLVEQITLRLIVLRDFDGSVHYIRNGEINVVTNMTKEFSFAVFDIGVAYKENIDEVIKVIQEVGEAVQKDPDFKGVILSPIEIFGIDRFEDSAVIIKARIKTLPIRQWEVMREFNGNLKKKFDEKNIEMPFPHVTVFMGQDKKGIPTALNLNTAITGENKSAGEA